MTKDDVRRIQLRIEKAKRRIRAGYKTPKDQEPEMDRLRRLSRVLEEA